ncbi:MAG: hypothetical protein SGI83_03965 [Bacteroidota bacterium]|nr:hypothetical protein [Bacteroidota bacterium]
MNKLFFSLFFLFYYGVITGNQKNKYEKPLAKLPVSISYMRYPPPDSIRDFMSAYLSSKKIEVIRWVELNSLLQQEMKADMMELITAGKLNEASATNFAKSMKPVCNILGMRIFKDTTNSNDFKIDSIHWFIGSMPEKEDKHVNLLFIPSPDFNTHPFYILKAFSDTVLASGQLK